VFDTTKKIRSTIKITELFFNHISDIRSFKVKNYRKKLSYKSYVVDEKKNMISFWLNNQDFYFLIQ
jgi:hypothetical protein